MPNWKSYESSVRLLSAIIAAHPELKLNYADIAKYYGGKTNYKSIWGRFTVLRGHADSLRDAFDNGVDPETVDLQDTTSGVAPKKSKEDKAISDAFGGDCTKSAIDNRFRKIKSHAALIKKALAANADPFLIPLDDKGSDASASIPTPKEIARVMGSDASAGGIKFQVAIRFRPLGRAMLALLAQGVDPKDVDLDVPAKKTESTELAEIAAFMGSDVTWTGLRFQFHDRLKVIAKRQADMRSRGQDPKDVDLVASAKKDSSSGGEIAAFMGKDVTAKAISHRIIDKIKPIAKAQAEKRSAGQDPGEVEVQGGDGNTGASASKNEISKHFGSDSTGGGIGFQFRQIKTDAKRQRACVASGGDPLSLGIGSVDEMSRLLKDATPSAIEHVFRPIKKAAQELRAEGGSAPSGGGPGSAKKRANPGKAAKPLKPEDDEDDEESGFQESPSKRAKPSLNKVQSGRVQKARASKPPPGHYTNLDSVDDDEDDEVVFSSPIKSEKGGRTGYLSSFENHNDHVNGNGRADYAVKNTNPFANVGDDYYDDPNEYA